MRPTPTRFAPALLTGFLLVGCSSGHGIAPPCPDAAILGDAADLRHYQPGGRDLTDLVIDSHVTGIVGKCSPGEGATLHTEVSVAFAVTRGPADHERTADLTYFVAVTRAGQILDKQILPLHVAFPRNVDTLHLTGAPVTLNLPTPKGISGGAYKVEVGFQLTPAELADNRARSSR